MKSFLVFLTISMFPFALSAQQKLKYDVDFTFKDGLYISFLDFKNNNPIPITHILSDFDIRDQNYLDQVLSSDSISYFDNLYEERIIAVESLWGYSQRGKVYIGFGASQSFDNPEFFDFYPLLTIGRVCFFTAYEAFYRSIGVGPQMGGFQDPMMFNDQMTVTETAQVQFIFKIEDGRLILADRGDLNGFPPRLIRDLIQSDPVLTTEFDSLNTKEQKQTGMFYIRKFNERNPVYFPVN